MTSQSTAAPIQHPDRLFIGGKWVKPSSAAKFDVVDSGTEERFLSVAEAQAADVEAAVAAAREAFDRGPWPRLPVTERAKYLRALAKELRARAPDFEQTWVRESGVTVSHAANTASHSASNLELYADLADTFPFVERHKSRASAEALLVREPVGVVAAIIPWNAPLTILINKVAPALLAGCAIIVKASPEAPSTAYIFAEICEKIGLPPGVVNILTADREVSELLVRNPGIDKVTFTGSSAAGRKVAGICGERMARYTMELGGKSAAVVLDDYDIEAAAKAIAGQATFMTGQVCVSLTRIIVPRQRHDAMVEALSANFAKVKVGDPFETDTGMGPLAMGRQRDRVEHFIAAGKAEGATLAIGGARPAHLNRGWFIEPTVFGNVDNNSVIGREEIFGPVLSVIPVDSEDQALDVANDTVYGLNNSVFTNDLDRAYEAARRLRSGTVGQNAMRVGSDVAFGGFKQSGVGRECGVEGLLPFLETKTVLLDGLPPSLRT